MTGFVEYFGFVVFYGLALFILLAGVWLLFLLDADGDAVDEFLQRQNDYFQRQARLAQGKRFDPLAVDEEIWVPHRDWVCRYCGQSHWSKDETCTNCGAPRDG